MSAAAAPVSSAARALLGDLRTGDRGALARAISAVEADSPIGSALVDELERAGTSAEARVIGFTGPPGAGKSTLVGQVAKELIDRGQRVGALLVDPSSAISGGAVLADRIRLPKHERERLYVRSVATRGSRGGLTATTESISRLLTVWGADAVLLETVGAGQSEVDVSRVATQTVLVCPPGLGDELQAMKAGSMEIADVFVVNKADRPGAAQTRGTLVDAGRGGRLRRDREVVMTTATTGEGVADLVALLDRLAAVEDGPRPNADLVAARARLAREASMLVRDLILSSRSDELDRIAEQSASGGTHFDTAALAAIRSVVTP